MGEQPDAPPHLQVATEARLLAVHRDLLKEVGLDQNKVVQPLDDLELNLILRVTQANRQSLSLTAPRVTVKDGEVGRTIFGIRGGVGVEERNPAARCITLAVRGHVADDRRTITLSAEVSCVDAPVGLPVDQVAVEKLMLPLREGALWANQDVIRLGGTVVDRGTILVQLPEAWLDVVGPAQFPRKLLLLLRPTIIVPSPNDELFPGLLNPAE